MITTSTNGAFDAWTNCCKGRRSGCPTIKIETADGMVRIRDDFGGEIKVSAAQFMSIVATGNEMIGDAIGAGLIKLSKDA